MSNKKQTHKSLAGREYILVESWSRFHAAPSSTLHNVKLADKKFKVILAT